MKIAIATIGQELWHKKLRDEYVDLARQDTVGTHALVDDADADIIAFVDLHQHPGDPHLRALSRHPLVRQNKAKIRVIDERDRPFFTFPGVYVSWPAGARGTKLVVGGCYHHLHTTAVGEGHRDPDLLFSFLGARTHRVREPILSLRHPRGIVEDTTALGFFDFTLAESRRVSAQDRYREVLSRSKFVICPRGHGATSFRLFETLSAGRVPVVISDAWTPPPGPDWEACALRIPERAAGDIASVLEASEERWPSMAKAAQDAWSTYFASHRRWNQFSEGLASLKSRPLRASWLQRERVRLRVLAARDRLRR